MKVIFFTGEGYNRLKIFLEEMSDQTIVITLFNVAYYYVCYCKQNKIKVNESKIDNYIDRMQQPLISDQLQEDFKNILMEKAIRYSKSSIANSLKFKKRGFDFLVNFAFTKSIFCH